MMLIRPFHLLLRTLLAGAFVFWGFNRAWAVVPPSVLLETEEKEQVQTKEEQLLEMIENVKERERQNMEMLEIIKMELIKLKEERCAP
jgi:hypothetical protein